MVSGTISLSSQEFFSPFPHGTSSLSVADEYLALRDGPRGFPQDSSCPVVLGIPNPLFRLSPTGLSPPPDRLSRTIRLDFQGLCRVPQPRIHRNERGLGSFPFARRYLGNRFFFLFLQVLRWFTSLSLLPHTIYSYEDDSAFTEPGSPIRTSPFLRSLAATRGFSQLATSFFAFPHQGIHH